MFICFGSYKNGADCEENKRRIFVCILYTARIVPKLIFFITL